MSDDGIDVGTLVFEIIAIYGDEAETTTWLNGNELTHEIGTMTGDDQVDGTVTVDGTYKNELTGIETKAVVGTDWIKLDGSDDGTFSHERTTADGDE
jgi:hypothetical protein